MKVWNSNPLKGPCGYHGGLPYHRTIETPGTSLCWCLHDDGTLLLFRDHIYGILRERRYPSILIRHKIKDVLLSCCLIVLESYCLVLLSCCLMVLVSYCLFVLLSWCLIILAKSNGQYVSSKVIMYPLSFTMNFDTFKGTVTIFAKEQCRLRYFN